MNTLVKDKSINDKYRKFPHPISARNLSNFVEDEVVMTLIQTVKNNYTHLSHRYYKIKAKMMGNDHLNYWDRNAPLATQEQKFSWEEAVDIVLISYAQFSPKLAELGKKFFDNNWIDVPMLAGKRHGAFAHPVVPSVHPYLMLNYNGNIRDVSTLAHELGHGVHMLLAAKQGPLMCDTPLTLAETASVFGEQLTFRYLLNLETDSSQRRNMIMHKIEDMLNTVVRQIAFCDFELRIHEERKNGELLPESLGKIWLEVSKESLGPVLIFDNDYQNFWAYIPHLIHSPFYVYSYAFGDCLVNSLYQTYLEKSVDNFEDKYFDMLSAGGILHYRDLLKPFNLDPTNPKFWQKGLDIIAQFIDEIE